jgi:hypothetical protein
VGLLVQLVDGSVGEEVHRSGEHLWCSLEVGVPHGALCIRVHFFTPEVAFGACLVHQSRHNFIRRTFGVGKQITAHHINRRTNSKDPS